MSVRQLVNVNIAILAVLATVLSGIGGANIAIPLCAVAAAVLSLWLTDFTKRFSLGRWSVNTALVLVAAVTALRFVETQAIGDLPVLADAFACVQIVLLFEKKTARTWWDLLSLGFIQVVFAALQDHGPLFGLVLVAYLFFGLSTFSLMFLYRERFPVDQRGGPGESASVPRESANRHSMNWGRLGKVILGTAVVGPLSLYLRFRERTQDDRSTEQPARTGSHSKRWPLLREEPTLDGLAGAAAGPPGVGREFWYRIAQMALISVVLSLIVFFTVPRFGGIDVSFLRYGVAGWTRTPVTFRRTIGYSDTVRLGELGTLLDDSEKVLEVEFMDHVTNEPYPVQGTVYLRGTVLTHYQNGRWLHRRSGSRLRLGHLPSVEDTEAVQLVRQRITIEPMGRSDLFCVWPLVFIAKNDQIWLDAHKESLGRSRGARGRRFVYELGTTAFSDGIQTDLAPCEVDVARVLQQWPSGSLPGLAALAEQWVSESGIAPDDPIGRARYLERRLHDSDQFTYSLVEPDRNSAIDPIEDFVVGNSEGNCEFFASTLTLMLRSQGIPARMVIGFKSGEYSHLSQTFIARNSYAHAWVEAFISPDRLGETPRQDDPLSDWSSGGWLRLDPTPAVSPGDAGGGLLARGLGYWFGKLRSFWREHVTGMSRSHQRRSLYEPLAARAKGIGVRLTSPEWWSNLTASTVATIRNLPNEASGRFGWRGGLACLVLLIVAVVAIGRVRRWSRGRKLQATRAGGPNGRNGREEIPFYRRLETLLGRHGLARAASQTHREFARESGIKLSESTGEVQIATLPLDVVNAFYQVRFGEADLDDSQLATVQKALRRIEQAARGKRKR